MLPLVAKGNTKDLSKIKTMETENSKKRKPGRPGKIIKKEVRAAVRFTPHEYFIVQEKAAQSGRSTSAYIRQAAIQAKIIQRLTEEEVQLIRQLAGISANINQLTKLSHQEGFYNTMKYFETYRQKIDVLLNKFKP